MHHASNIRYLVSHFATFFCCGNSRHRKELVQARLYFSRESIVMRVSAVVVVANASREICVQPLNGSFISRLETVNLPPSSLLIRLELRDMCML